VCAQNTGHLHQIKLWRGRCTHLQAQPQAHFTGTVPLLGGTRPSVGGAPLGKRERRGRSVYSSGNSGGSDGNTTQLTQAQYAQHLLDNVDLANQGILIQLGGPIPEPHGTRNVHQKVDIKEQVDNLGPHYLSIEALPVPSPRESHEIQVHASEQAEGENHGDHKQR
jgi:hypothetical protein